MILGLALAEVGIAEECLYELAGVRNEEKAELKDRSDNLQGPGVVHQGVEKLRPGGGPEQLRNRDLLGIGRTRGLAPHPGQSYGGDQPPPARQCDLSVRWGLRDGLRCARRTDAGAHRCAALQRRYTPGHVAVSLHVIRVIDAHGSRASRS